MSKKAQPVQEGSRCKGIQGGTSKEEIKCVCLNARSIIIKKNELNIMVDDIKPHIIGITESWANNDIKDAELGLEGYVMFRKDRIGRRGGVLLYIKETIPAYEVQLQEEAGCNEAIWCKLVTGHTTVTIGVVYRCPNITKQNNNKIHLYLYRRVCVYVCVYPSKRIHVALCGPIGTKFGTHMQIHLVKVVGKIKICPVSRRGNLGGFRGSEIENVGNLPNGWTD